MAATGLGLLVRLGLVPGIGLALMLILYGVRLSLYLLIRERESRHAARMGRKGMVLGLVIESGGPHQKSGLKSVLPEHFVDTGLFRLVRYPNYLGEMIFWTGVFVSGIGVFTGALQWIVEILRYTRIVYEMFGGARCLEIRQNRRYGQGSEYQAHVKSHPICRL